MLGAAGHVSALVTWDGQERHTPWDECSTGSSCRHRLQLEGVDSGLLGTPDVGLAAAWPKTSPWGKSSDLVSVVDATRSQAILRVIS